MKHRYVDLTTEELEGLKSRISNSTLTEQDRSLCSDNLDLLLWLQSELKESKLSIKRLRQLFGIKTEKKSPKLTKLHQALMEIQS